MEDGEGEIGDEFRGRREEKILEPSDVAVSADLLVAIAEGRRRSSSVFLVSREAEEVDGFFFQLLDELSRNAMVSDFEEAELLTGFDEVVLGIRV